MEVNRQAVVPAAPGPQLLRPASFPGAMSNVKGSGLLAVLMLL